MKANLRQTILKVLFMFLVVMTTGNAQTLAGWTFEAATTPAAPGTPNNVLANLGPQAGTAAVYANGTNGSSTWITATTGNELTAFGGSVLNDPRSTPVAGNSYSPVGGASNSANGKSIVVKFSTTGFENPILTFATRGTGTGFATHSWSYSTDGITFTSFSVANTANTTTTYLIRTLDFTSIDALDNQSDVYIKLTFTGATTSTGNNRIDNIMVNATAVGASGPSVTTGSATLVTTTSATLNGSINANGVATDTSFEYGLTTSYGSTITGSPASVNTSVSEAITASLSSLSPNTLYNFRAVGTVSPDITNGNNTTFTTLANVPSSPVVVNPTLTSLDVTIGSGDGNPATTSYAIRVNGTQYVQADGTLGVSAVWQTAAIWATKTVTGLTENTSYSFAVKARNSAFVETAFSTATIVLTPASIVAPVANLANDVTQTSFVANWSSVPTATSYGLDVSDSPTFSTTGVTTNLIISEYGEGAGGNKKYIEIYNGTGAAVNLANYQVWKTSNGGDWNFNSTNTTPTTPISLTGTLANGATYVVANNSTDVIGSNLQDTNLNFNGNDAIGLAYNGGSGTVFTILDAVGTANLGVANPTSGWAVAGTANATVDKILIRKPTVLSPNTNWTASAGTTVANSEWIVSSFVYNSTTQTTNLGTHSVSQPSFLPGYENLLVSGTSQTVTGLTLDTTYYYRVRASNAFNTSANSNVVSVLTASPQNVTEIISPLCGSTLSSMSQLVQVRNFTPSKQITGYRYKIEGPAGFLQIIEKATPHFDFRTVTGWEYGKTYTVSCELQKSGVWYGFYGPSCSISTPNVIATGLSQIVSPTCDTIVTPNTIIATTSLGGVTGYLFRVTNTTPGYAGANTVQTKERTPHWFRLNMLDEYVYNSTYTVEVAVKTSGTYGAFGPVCTFTTTIPVIAQCGTTVNAGSLISSTSLGGVTQYAYQVTNLSDSSVQNIDRTSPHFSTSLITGYSSTTPYSVSVAVTSTGVQSPFTQACTINASPAAREINASYASELKVQGFPNPFTNNFTLDITRASEEKVAVMVYDMIGKLLDRVDVNATDNSLELGANYPAGVYNVVVSQGEKVETVRMVKR